MKAKLLALPLLSAICLAGSAAAAEDAAASSLPAYAGNVDPAAFPERPGEHKKLGVTVSPAAVRVITPGIDKFSIYKLIGPPHFGEGITRRWNYVLFFPPAAGDSERMRCRMEIRFEKPPGRYNVVVSEVVWQEQVCADRVATAN